MTSANIVAYQLGPKLIQAARASHNTNLIGRVSEINTNKCRICTLGCVPRPLPGTPAGRARHHLWGARELGASCRPPAGQRRGVGADQQGRRSRHILVAVLRGRRHGAVLQVPAQPSGCGRGRTQSRASAAGCRRAPCHRGVTERHCPRKRKHRLNPKPRLQLFLPVFVVFLSSPPIACSRSRAFLKRRCLSVLSSGSRPFVACGTHFGTVVAPSCCGIQRATIPNSPQLFAYLSNSHGRIRGDYSAQGPLLVDTIIPLAADKQYQPCPACSSHPCGHEGIPVTNVRALGMFLDSLVFGDPMSVRGNSPPRKGSSHATWDKLTFRERFVGRGPFMRQLRRWTPA